MFIHVVHLFFIHLFGANIEAGKKKQRENEYTRIGWRFGSIGIHTNVYMVIDVELHHSLPKL